MRKERKVAKVSGNEQLTSTDAQEKAASRARETPAEPVEGPRILEEICVEELAIDGICGVY